MALPASLSAELRTSAWKLGRSGPFQNGSNLYGVFHDNTGNTVEVWKSTNGGDTWAEQDAANHKATTSTVAAKSFDVIQAGTTLYIVYISATGAGGTIRVVPFDMATDTYGTVTGDLSVALPGADNTNTYGVMIARRSNGNIIVGYRSVYTNMATDYSQTSIATWNGSSWTTTLVTPATTTVNYPMRGMVMGPSDLLHIFYQDTAAADIYHRSFNSSGTLGFAGSALETTGKASPSYGQSFPIAYDVGGTTRIGWLFVDSDLGLDFSYFASTSSPNSGDVTNQNVSATSTSNPEEVSANPGFVVERSDVLYAFWPDDTTNDIYRDSDGGSGTWGTDTEWKDAVTANAICGAVIDSGAKIGVFYLDGTTVKYDAYPLAATFTRTAAQTAAISTPGLTRQAAQSAAIRVANITRTGAQSAAISTPGLTRQAAQSAAIRVTNVRVASQSAAISVANITKTAPQSAAIGIPDQTRQAPQSAAILVVGVRTAGQTASISVTAAFTRTAPQTAAISTPGLTRQATQTAAVQVTNVRSAGQTAAISIPNLSRFAAQSAAILVVGVRSTAQTAAISVAGLSRTAAQSAAISVAGNARIAAQSAAILVVGIRTAGQTAAIQVRNQTRTAAQTAAIQVTNTRTAGQTAAISVAGNTRTAVQTASIRVTAIRTAGQTAAIRVNAQTRTAPQSASILVTGIRQATQSAAILVVGVRSAGQTAAIRTPGLTRTAAQTASISTPGIGNIERYAPQSAAISTPGLQRMAAQSATILVQGIRAAPQSAAISVPLQTRTAPQDAAIAVVDQTRTAPQTASIIFVLSREAPQTAAITLLALSRTAPQTASISVTELAPSYDDVMRAPVLAGTLSGRPDPTLQGRGDAALVAPAEPVARGRSERILKARR
jgi:hypothetical protein